MRVPTRAHTGGLGFEPFRVRNSRALPVKNVVACPDCGAGIGQPCMTRAGKATSQRSYHASRVRLAARADLDRRTRDAQGSLPNIETEG